MISPADMRFIENGLLAFAIGVPRAIVCCYLVHVFGSSILPKTLRLALAMGFSIPVISGAWAALGHAGTEVPLIALIFKESLLGLLLGLSLCMPFWAVEAVGALLDNQRGANAAQQVTPFAVADLSMTGAILRMSLIAFMGLTGSLTAMYELMLESYDAWPVLTLVPDLTGFGPEEMAARFTEFTRLSVLYAAPIMAVVGLIDLGFAFIGIFSPNLPTYFAAMPVKSIVGMLILALYAGTLMTHGSDYFERTLDVEFSALRTIHSHR
jgi:type III secretion protein T